MKNYWLFPTQISVIENFISLEQCNDIVEYMRDKVTDYHKLIEGDGKSTHTPSSDCITDISKNVASCTDLKTLIDNAFNQVAKSYGIPSINIGNSWVNYQNKDSKLSVHAHPRSILSLALYLKSDEHSSTIRFYNPNPFIRYWADLDNDKEISNEWYDYLSSVGTAYIFPSWLLHGGSFANKSKERVVLSCNTY